MPTSENGTPMTRHFVFPMIILFTFISLSLVISRDLPLAPILEKLEPTNFILLKSKIMGFLSFAALVFLLIVSRYTTVTKIFYGILTLSAVVSLLFTFVLFPYAEALQPVNQDPFVKNWIPISFYLLTSLWAGVGFILFWGYANSICTFKQAAKSYPIIALAGGFISNILLLILGPVIAQNTLHETDVSLILVGCSILSLGTFYWMNSRLKNERDLTKFEAPNSLFKSSYILALAILAAVIALSKPLIEIPWKVSVKEVFPIPTEYASMMGFFSIWTGVTALLFGTAIFIFMAIYLSKWLGKGWKWFGICLSLVPLVFGVACLITAIPFGTIGVLSGAFYQAAVKGVTIPALGILRDMALIPVVQHNRFTAKIIVDLVFASVGSALGIFFIVLTGSLQFVFPYTAVLFLIVMVIWLLDIRFISNRILRLRT